MVSTMAQIEKTLARGPHVFRYEAADDFGDAGDGVHDLLVLAHRRFGAHGPDGGGARVFRSIARLPQSTWDHVRGHRRCKPANGWGNYPQTYSQVGIINCAMRLSRSWEKAI